MRMFKVVECRSRYVSEEFTHIVLADDKQDALAQASFLEGSRSVVRDDTGVDEPNVEELTEEEFRALRGSRK